MLRDERWCLLLTTEHTGSSPIIIRIETVCLSLIGRLFYSAVMFFFFTSYFISQGLGCTYQALGCTYQSLGYTYQALGYKIHGVEKTILPLRWIHLIRRIWISGSVTRESKGVKPLHLRCRSENWWMESPWDRPVTAVNRLEAQNLQGLQDGAKAHSLVKLKLKGCKQHSSGKLKLPSS